jgi:hypothetical protein
MTTYSESVDSNLYIERNIFRDPGSDGVLIQANGSYFNSSLDISDDTVTSGPSTFSFLLDGYFNKSTVNFYSQKMLHTTFNISALSLENSSLDFKGHTGATGSTTEVFSVFLRNSTMTLEALYNSTSLTLQNTGLNFSTLTLGDTIGSWTSPMFINNLSVEGGEFSIRLNCYVDIDGTGLTSTPLFIPTPLVADRILYGDPLSYTDPTGNVVLSLTDSSAASSTLHTKSKSAFVWNTGQESLSASLFKTAEISRLDLNTGSTASGNLDIVLKGIIFT